MSGDETIDCGISVLLLGIQEQEPGHTRWPVSCGSRGGAWFCAETHYGQDERAVAELAKQGFTTFHPMVWERRTKGERVRRVEVAMFPGYVFVRFDPLSDQWGSVVHTRGIRGLIQVANRPAHLSDDVISMIASNATELNAEFEAAASAVHSKGAALRVTKGPWAGMDGVCLWHRNDRIRMMMMLFGRETPVEFSVSDVAIAAPGEQALGRSPWRLR